MNQAEILLIHLSRRTRIRFNLSGIYPMLPLGIAMLGAALEQNGEKPQLLDLTLPELSFVPQNDLGEHCRFVGLSATLFSLPEASVVSSQIKKYRPDLPVVLGGPAVTIGVDALARRLPDVDVFVLGEGENAITRLASGGFRTDSLASIPGIAFRNNGDVVTTPPGEAADLDQLPYPARHLLPRGRYSMHPPFGLHPPVTVMETARGCPYQCRFCSFRSVIRQRSVEHVMGEIEQVIANETVGEVHFVDPTFTADLNRAQDLAAALGELPKKLAWSFKTRADLVSEPLLAECAKAGCYMISYGIESFSDQALEHLGKGHSAAVALSALKATKRAGIRTIAYMLVGNPGDTNQTVKQTVATLRRVRCDYALFSGIFPDPNSLMSHGAYENGKLKKQDVDNFYFEGTSIPGGNSWTGFDDQTVRSWVIGSFLRFYFHPVFLIRRVLSLQGWREAVQLMRGAISLIGDFAGSFRQQKSDVSASETWRSADREGSE